VAAPASKPASLILVLGVGNTLMRDDGIGVRLMDSLAALQPALPDTEYVDAGTISLLLLPMIERCDALLVLDAAHLGGEPGGVRSFEGNAMDQFLRTARCSVHEVSVRDLLDVARLTGHLPQRRALVGIQPLEVGWGEQLSVPVARALPGAVQAARSILLRWGAGDA
jgi:hydrogenase maturation protease